MIDANMIVGFYFGAAVASVTIIVVGLVVLFWVLKGSKDHG